jgi:hypothetical protein
VIVSTPLGKQLSSNVCYKDCEIRIGGDILKGDLIRLPIDDYDITLGMDLLSQHNAKVDCKEKVVHFYKSEDKVLEFKGERRNIKNCLVSGVRARKIMYKGCIGYMAYLLNKPSEPRKIEEVPVVKEYLDVFPAELTKVPPDKEVEFAIDLLPTVEPVSRTPYRMAPTELAELKKQLQELLNQGFIRPSVSL